MNVRPVVQSADYTRMVEYYNRLTDLQKTFVINITKENEKITSVILTLRDPENYVLFGQCLKIEKNISSAELAKLIMTKNMERRAAENICLIDKVTRDELKAKLVKQFNDEDNKLKNITIIPEGEENQLLLNSLANKLRGKFNYIKVLIYQYPALNKMVMLITPYVWEREKFENELNSIKAVLQPPEIDNSIKTKKATVTELQIKNSTQVMQETFTTAKALETTSASQIALTKTSAEPILNLAENSPGKGTNGQKTSPVISTEPTKEEFKFKAPFPVDKKNKKRSSDSQDNTQINKQKKLG